jgi:hypothetical protein
MNRPAALRLLGLFGILAALVGYTLRVPHTPPRQRPLATIKADNLSGFRSTFNDAAGNVRLLLLFSPT